MTTSPNAVLEETATQPDEECVACSHPMATHDAAGLRYCAATLNMGRTRGCICKIK
jgi:hypothetical protein